MSTFICILFFTACFLAPFIVIHKNAQSYADPKNDDLKWYLMKDKQKQRNYLIDKYLKKKPGRDWTIAFKGFRSDMSCRGFSYIEGHSYQCEGKPVLCSNGFHACIFPRDCYNHYCHPDDVYHIVFLKNLCAERENGDSKICGGTICIGPEIDSKYIRGVEKW